MADNLLDLIYKASSTFLFIAAVTTLLIMINSSTGAIEAVEGSRWDRTTSDGITSYDDYYITGEQIINQLLLGRLSHRVTIIDNGNLTKITPSGVVDGIIVQGRSIKYTIEGNHIENMENVSPFDYNYKKIIQMKSNYDIHKMINHNGIVTEIIFINR